MSKLELLVWAWMCNLQILITDSRKSNFKDAFDNKQRFTIENLGSYLNLFDDCLVHLINYEAELDLKDYGLPIVLSRYVHIIPGIHSDGRFEVMVPVEHSNMDGKINVSRYTKDTFPKLERSSQYNWRCRAQFYLLPRTRLGEYGHSSFTMPKAFGNFWIRSSFWNYVSSTGEYHVLVQRPSFETERWLSELAFIFRGRPINLMTLYISISSFPNITSPFEIACQLCSAYETATQLPYSIPFPYLTRKLLDYLFLNVSKINNGVSWRSFRDKFGLYIITESQSSYENLLLDKLGLAVNRKQISFTNIHEYIPKNILSIEMLFFYIAVKNASICNLEIDSYNRKRHPRFFFEAGSLFFINKEDQYSFITCGVAGEKKIDFRGLISAFDLPTWLSVITFYVVLGLTLSISNNLTLNLKLKLDHLFVGFKLFLEQGFQASTDANKSGLVYFLSGSFCLLSVVLSNAYRGTNIQEITAPPRPRILTAFRELVEYNFTIYTRGMYEMISDEPTDENERNKNSCTRPIEIAGSKFYRGEYKFYSEELKTQYGHMFSKSDYDFFFSTLNSQVEVYPHCQRLISKNITFVDILKDCNLTAYIDWGDELGIIERKLRMLQPPITGHISKGSTSVMGTRKLGWDLELWVDSGIIRRISGLVESGIANQWRYVYTFSEFYAYNLYTKPNKEFKPLTTSDNISTVFILLVGCLAVSSGFYFIEFSFFWRKRIQTGVKNLFWTFIELATVLIVKPLMNVVHYIKIGYGSEGGS